MNHRSESEIRDQLRAWVDQFGLHSTWVLNGERCCRLDELDAAIEREIRDRRDNNSSSMIVTTGMGDSPAGVYLPAPIGATS